MEYPKLDGETLGTAVRLKGFTSSSRDSSTGRSNTLEAPQGFGFGVNDRADGIARCLDLQEHTKNKVSKGS